MYKIRNYIKNYFYPTWPDSATTEYWAAWHKKAKKRKFAYWMTTTMPTYIAVKGMQLDDFRYWFKYRFQKKHKYHLINTGLKPAYYELEERMLHGNFNMLKDFVEIEKSSLYRISHDDKLLPREAALKHLDWEIALINDPDEFDFSDRPEVIGKPTEQALNAQVIKDLYIWWVDMRPLRLDPWDDDFMANKASGKQPFYEILAKKSPEEEKARKEFQDSKQAIEDAYEKEDDEMLAKLISIRRTLWS